MFTSVFGVSAHWKKISKCSDTSSRSSSKNADQHTIAHYLSPDARRSGVVPLSLVYSFVCHVEGYRRLFIYCTYLMLFGFSDSRILVAYICHLRVCTNECVQVIHVCGRLRLVWSVCDPTVLFEGLCLRTCTTCWVYVC